MIAEVVKKNIVSNKPYVDDRVLEYIKEVLGSGKMSGDGAMCKHVEHRLETMFNSRHMLLTTSCTHALEMAMMMLDLQPGDEVITPSFTFVSAANAIIHGKGRPVFCELDERTLTIDVEDFEQKITPRTKAVMPMHYAGVAAEMDAILDVARSHNIKVIEDAAQGVNAKYKGKFLGTIGDAGAYSFHDTKNLISGEGGAFITDDESMARRAEIIREKGTNRANFLRGEVDKYTWVDCGSSYVLSDILAAVLNHQLDFIETIQNERRRVHQTYMEGLKDLESRELLRLPIIPGYCESNYHIFYILLRTEKDRNQLMKNLKEAGISATFHYIPLHSAPYAREVLGTGDVKLPKTDKISSTLLRLPIYPQLTNDDVYYVIEKVNNILK